jgi:3-hydroxybutyryl-CoA dehydrogenase
MKLEDIQNVMVAGTGMMGSQIAVVFTRAGYDVTVCGSSDASAQRGDANFKRNLQDLLGQQILSSEDADAVLRRFHSSSDLEAAAKSADFIVEAIQEDLERKQNLFVRLEELSRSETILTSTTSTLSPTLLSKKMRNASRMLVTHFWNPAYLCPLVEVCASKETSQEAIQVTMALLTKIGNKPVLLKKEILGFIGNRLMHAMNREAISMIQKGIVTARDIDEAVLASFGPRFANLGPMEYLDFVGLDLVANIQNYLYDDLEKGGGTMGLLQEKVQKNELGAKSGSGLSDWSKKNPDDVRARRDQEFMRRLKEELKK